MTIEELTFAAFQQGREQGREESAAQIERLRRALTDAYDCFRVYGEHMPEYMHGEAFEDHLNRYRAALQPKEGE